MTNKLLTERSAALKLIKDIRETRSIVTTTKMCSDLVAGINGSNGALEALVGHDVVVGAMDDQQKINLRREILGRLTEEEYKANRFIRNTIHNYFDDISQAFATEGISTKIKNSVTGLTFRTKAEDVSAFLDKPASGCFSVEGLNDVESAVEVFCEFLDTITPVVERIYDEQQLAAENGEGDGATAAPPEKIEPDPPETEPLEHQILVDPNEEALKDIIKACKTNKSLTSATERFIHDPSSLKAIGYTDSKVIIASIEKIGQIWNKMSSTALRFRDLWSDEKLNTINATVGTELLFDAVDSVVGLIHRTDVIRARLEESLETLTAVVK